ncbi:caleosin, partial [Cladochytrium replicatum]
SVLANVPITVQHPAPVELEATLGNAGTPRANIACSQEMPEGSADGKPHLTVLQQHMEFFDRDKNGIVYPWETFLGFYALGFNWLFSILTILLTEFYSIQDSWIPNPLMPIYIKNSHRLKHGSDSDVYDEEGRFVPEKFEELFSKFDKDKKKALTLNEILEMTKSMRNIGDLVGMTAMKLEWLTLYMLCGKNGMIDKESIRRQYDGTLFYRIERQRK